MIAYAKKPRQPKSAWHADFLNMLPAIERRAQIALRHLGAEAREEAMQEVVANTLVAYLRLVELGKADIAYPTVLARYAAAQVLGGRKVGGRMNVRDVMSSYAQQKKGFKVARLESCDGDTGQWQEILVEDRHATPADVAASRIDFAAWLRSLSSRYRKIATTLAAGETTSKVAQMFRLSRGRVSQLRRELCESWQEFHGAGAVADPV
jgi:hypothetical protein